MKPNTVTVFVALVCTLGLAESEKSEHWSFRNLAPTPIPQTKRAERLRTPVDAFVLAKLEATGLAFSPDANRATLLRRVYLDLIGLPPRLDEILLAGGGFKPGHVHGATDDFGYRSVVDRVSCPDLHATILHQLGLDHERLTYRHNRRDETLTDPSVSEARVVREILS